MTANVFQWCRDHAESIVATVSRFPPGVVLGIRERDGVIQTATLSTNKPRPDNIEFGRSTQSVDDVLTKVANHETNQ